MRTATPRDAAVLHADSSRSSSGLTYEGDAYGLRMRKRITNVGETPVSRFFIRVAVDRYPNDPHSRSWSP